MRKTIIFLMCMGITWSVNCSIKKPELVSITKNKDAINEIKFNDFTLTLDLVMGKGKDKNDKFKSPSSLAVDSAGNIYIADMENNRIQIFSDNGEYIRSISGKSAVKIKLFSPGILAIDNDDNLYIAERDKRKRRVLIISKEGKLINSFKTPLYPYKMDVYKDNIYIGEKGGSQEYNIFVCSKKGKIVAAMEKSTNMKYFDRSVTFTIDKEGNIYTANRFLPKVKKYFPYGKRPIEFEYEPSIKNKRDLEEHYVTDVIMDPNVRGKGTVAMEFKEDPICFDIAIDNSGIVNLLVASSHNKEEDSTLYRFDQQGQFIEKVDLPFSCGKIYIDSFNNFYFISTIVSRGVFKFKPALINKVNGSFIHKRYF